MRWFAAILFPLSGLAAFFATEGRSGVWADVLARNGERAQAGEVLLSADAFTAVQCAGWASAEATLCFHYPYGLRTGFTDPLASLQAAQILRRAGIGAIVPMLGDTSPSVLVCVRTWIERDWRSLTEEERSN